MTNEGIRRGRVDHKVEIGPIRTIVRTTNLLVAQRDGERVRSRTGVVTTVIADDIRKVVMTVKRAKNTRTKIGILVGGLMTTEVGLGVEVVIGREGIGIDPIEAGDPDRGLIIEVLEREGVPP